MNVDVSACRNNYKKIIRNFVACSFLYTARNGSGIKTEDACISFVWREIVHFALDYGFIKIEFPKTKHLSGKAWPARVATNILFISSVMQ